MTFPARARPCTVSPGGRAAGPGERGNDSGGDREAGGHPGTRNAQAGTRQPVLEVRSKDESPRKTMGRIAEKDAIRCQNPDAENNHGSKFHNLEM